MQPEKLIENEILRWLGFRGIFCWKIKSVGTFDQKLGKFRRPSNLYKKGVSDILGILPGGRLLAIEVKSMKGRLNPHQKIFLEEITQRGGLAFVARSSEDVEKHLGEIIARNVVTPISRPT